MRLKKMQEIEVDNVAKIQAAKDVLKEIKGKIATLAQIAKYEEIQSLRTALANQISASVGNHKVWGDIAGAIRAATPSIPMSLNQVRLPTPTAPFAEKTEVSFKSLSASTPLDLSIIERHSGDHLSEDEP
jgi:hypothetical protein